MRASKIFFFEEGVRSGGVGEKLASALLENGYKGDYSLTAVDDEFVKQATIAQLYEEYGFSAEKIALHIKETLA